MKRFVLPTKIKNRLAHAKHITLLLDFDGTLAPLVRRPHLARISPRLKSQIHRLSKKAHWSVGIVSGRDLPTVKKKMGLSHLIYAGNHGYEIQFPGKKTVIHPVARKTRPVISGLCSDLKKHLKKIRGAMVENKVYSASLHTRTLSRKNEKDAQAIFFHLLNPFIKKKKVRVTKGKKVLEIRPPAEWDKGKAVLFILKKLKTKGLPIYIGDDRTDEDAFRALRKRGLGIRVGKKGPSSAHFQIESVAQMPQLIKALDLRV